VKFNINIDGEINPIFYHLRGKFPDTPCFIDLDKKERYALEEQPFTQIVKVKGTKIKREALFSELNELVNSIVVRQFQ